MSIDHVPSTEPTVIEVRTPWCPACSAMERDLQHVAAQFADTVSFIQVDAASDPGMAANLGARSTPTIVAYRDGNEVYRSVGRLTLNELERLFAGVGDHATFPNLRKRDVAIRVGAGAGIIILGLATGPTWPLVGIGMIAAIFGGVTWLRTR